MEFSVISSSSSEDENERSLKPVCLQEGLVFLRDGEVIDNVDAGSLTAVTSATRRISLSERVKHKSNKKKLRDLKRSTKYKAKRRAASQRTGLQPDAATQNEQLPDINSIMEFPALGAYVEANEAMQLSGVATTSFEKQLQQPQTAPSGLSDDNQASAARSLYGGATDILVLENNASGSSTRDCMLRNQEEKVSSLLWTSANSSVENQNITTENEPVMKKDVECQTVSTGDIILLNLFTGSDIGFMKIEEVQEYLGILHG